MKLQYAGRFRRFRSAKFLPAKIVVVLAIAVFSISLLAADKPAQQNPEEISPGQANQEQYLKTRPVIIDDGTGQFPETGLLLHDYPASISASIPKDAWVCYSMRTYVVKREDRDSDVTHPAGYKVCQPASQFHTKDAVGSPATIIPQSP